MSDSWRQDIITALARSLGGEHARNLVESHTQALGFNGQALTREQALAVLEEIANQPGIVGITGRFAKARLHIASK